MRLVARRIEDRLRLPRYRAPELLSRLCIHDNQLSRLVLVPASNVAGMGFGPAANNRR